MNVCAPCHAQVYGELRGDKDAGIVQCGLCKTMRPCWHCVCSVSGVESTDPDYTRAERALGDLKKSLPGMVLHAPTGDFTLGDVFEMMLDCISHGVAHHKAGRVYQVSTQPTVTRIET